MDNSLPRSALVLIDLADAEELSSLEKNFMLAGLDAEPLIGEGELSEAIRQSGADYVLADARNWSDLSKSLPRPPRSYLIILILDPEEESRAAAALAEGAFDYVLRDGPGWESRVAIYFKALAAARRRLASAIGVLERRYENLVHALPDIVYELDAEGHFTFINNSVRLLGYEPAELSGKHFPFSSTRATPRLWTGRLCSSSSMEARRAQPSLPSFSTSAEASTAAPRTWSSG